MKIELWVVGKNKTDWVRMGERMYLDKMTRFCPVQYTVIPAERSGNAAYVKSRESARLLERMLKAPMYTILLDERGKQQESRQFATYIQKKMEQHGGRLRFIIGGAYGVDHPVREAVDGVIALSDMIFPHELVRIIFLEQLYRAFTILRGESYHHS